MKKGYEEKENMNLTGNLRKGLYTFEHTHGVKSGFYPSNNSQAFSDNSSKQIVCCSGFKGGVKALYDSHSLKSLIPRGPSSGGLHSPLIAERSIKRPGKDVHLNSFYNNSPCHTNFFEE